MSAAEETPLISVKEYLSRELASESKHEYLGGYVYAMAGAKTVHDRVAGAFYGSLFAQLQGAPCEPFTSDMKVRIQTSNHTRFYYPDGMVVCTPTPPDTPYQDQPAVVAEVLSESTRRTDLGEKLDAYLTIPSLQVCLLIETEQPFVILHRRRADSSQLAGGFDMETYSGLDAVIPLPEVSASLPLRDLYARVEFGERPETKG